MLSRVGSRLSTRSFSKYIADNYGKNVHRLANRPTVEVSVFEIFAATVGTLLILGDIVRDQTIHRELFDANGQPEEVWNQRIWLRPRGFHQEGNLMGRAQIW
ncbi:unnamed protein product [Oikopleura dioica]|uniref:Uncharacterized protein n=1 Tax=Oikopleura dioica TaxID=34765 RepID=E4XDL1_OIKDI|nr:unnamed protein product [Oikopleura dioica]CBY43641.1 unnamed protein product [Oikopleura dioica]